MWEEAGILSALRRVSDNFSVFTLPDEIVLLFFRFLVEVLLPSLINSSPAWLPFRAIVMGVATGNSMPLDIGVGGGADSAVFRTAVMVGGAAKVGVRVTMM